MFEDLEVLAARLQATAPAQDNPCQPTLDPAGDLIEELVALARVIAAAQAQTMLIQAALCEQAETWQNAHDPHQEARVGPEDLVAAEIGPALHLTPRTAAIHVGRAADIVTRLPRTMAALRRGELDLGRVLTIWSATVPLDDADAGRVEGLVLAKAVNQNAGELRKSLAKAVIAIDPGAAERRRKDAIKERGVSRYEAKDGTCHLDAILSAFDTGEIYDLIDQAARQTSSPATRAPWTPAVPTRWCSCSPGTAPTSDPKTPTRTIPDQTSRDQTIPDQTSPTNPSTVRSR
jgi:hypothetical protein